MAAGGGPADRSRAAAAILLFGAVSAALLGWMWFGFRTPLAALLRDRGWQHVGWPDLAIGDRAEETVVNFFGVLSQNADAAALFRGMFTGPELYFPAAFAAFLFLLLLKVVDGARFFNLAVEGPLRFIVLAQPLTYALADYAENAVFYLLTGTPQDGTLLALAPWLTAIKFIGGTLSLVFLLRFGLLRTQRDTAG